MFYRAKLLDYFRSRDRGWILSLFAAVCLLYLPFLGSPFVFDDLTFVLGGVAGKYAHSWFHFDLRWLPYATLGWTEMWFSNVVTHFFHLGNLLLHAANVILLFYLLRQWLDGVVADNKDTNTIVWGAWFGALIFALHPVAVYAVGYVVERSILLATFFALLMQLAYLRGLLSGQARWLVLAAVAYFLAVFSKEHSVMLPAVLAAQTVLLRGKNRASARALWLAWAAFFAIGLLITLRASGVFGTPYEAMAADLFKEQGIIAGTPMLHLLSAMTQAGLFFKYLLLWLLPNPAWMAIDMREPFVASLAAWQGWLGALGFVAYGALGGWLLLRPRWAGLAGLALLYPWLQFMLEFSSIRVQEPFVLYRSYLWMPGMLLFIPLLLAQWPNKKTFLALGLTALLLAPLAVNRLWVFADNYRLWNDAALLLPDDRVPGADRILFNRGQAEMGVNKRDAAIADFQRVVAISPQYAPVRFELGWAYGVTGRYQDAMIQFDAAIADDPDFANAYYGKALLLKIRHEDKQAAELMAKSCELKNKMACLIVNRYIEH
jgi:hypothetical protein